jgi:hypothetical protein
MTRGDRRAPAPSCDRHRRVSRCRRSRGVAPSRNQNRPSKPTPAWIKSSEAVPSTSITACFTRAAPLWRAFHRLRNAAADTTACVPEKMSYRYVSRPPVASERPVLTASDQVRYTPNTPYRDGTTQARGQASVLSDLILSQKSHRVPSGFPRAGERSKPPDSARPRSNIPGAR